MCDVERSVNMRRPTPVDAANDGLRRLLQSHATVPF